MQDCLTWTTCEQGAAIGDVVKLSDADLYPSTAPPRRQDIDIQDGHERYTLGRAEAQRQVTIINRESSSRQSSASSHLRKQLLRPIWNRFEAPKRLDGHLPIPHPKREPDDSR